jgi:molecular chaperone GrpE
MSETVQPDTPEPAQPPEETASDMPADDPGPLPGAARDSSVDLEAEATDESGAEAEVVELDPAAAREAELQKQLDELQARLRAVSSAYREQQDEIAETKARLERQAALKEEMRRGEVLAALFDPVENLKRSLDAARKGASPEDTATGLEMVHKAFMAAFEKLGLEEVPGAGARFDPNLHEALTLVPVTDPALDGVVLEVFSAGYRIGGRLIKAARVVVGQHQEPVGEA